MSFSGPEIIAIDDDLAFVKAIKGFFAQHDIQISTVTDPDVCRAINFSAFRVVILDLNMPSITGQEILQSLPSAQRPFVIIVSGQNDLDTRLDLLDLGADLFLAKPIDPTELYLICKRALERKHCDLTHNGKWVLSTADYQLIAPSSEEFRLTTTEFLILRTLITASPAVVAKPDLVKVIAPQNKSGLGSSERTLEVVISRLRKRFRSQHVELPVKSQRNVGYVFHGNGVVTS